MFKAHIFVLSTALICSSLCYGGKQPEGVAPSKGMITARWASGIKQGFGTAYEAYDSRNRFSATSSTAPISKVWFTISEGTLSEVYWPTIDMPQTRDTQILVTDGSTFFFEERTDSISSVKWLAEGIPAFVIENKDPNGRFAIRKTIFADPHRNSILQKVELIRNRPGLQFFLLHNAHAGNTPMGNTAHVSLDKAPGSALYANQSDAHQAVVFNIPLKQVSAGYVGKSDGYQDINSDMEMDFHYEWAYKGNVATTAWLDIPEGTGSFTFTTAIGFGNNQQTAYDTARKSLENPNALLSTYMQQWKNYLDSLADLSATSLDGGKLFRASIAVLKSSEDKTYEGGFIASPSIPWGLNQQDNNELATAKNRPDLTGGYHLIWPRDLYQMATTFLALEDPKSAVASLNFLKRIQLTHADGVWDYGSRKRSKDGTFPQNCWADGEAYWVNLQMDEIALPVVLAYRLWQQGLVRVNDYWDMVKRAADFIEDFGPWSPQERWEEIYGASPSTLGSQIAALWLAAEFAKEVGDHEREQKYRSKADHWAAKPGDNIDTWTFTHSGIHGNGRYYQRIEGAGSWNQVWNPNDDQGFFLANGAGWILEKDLTDGGFLELVRLGIKGALNPNILDSIPEMDATIRVDVPGVGPGFHRYYRDRYNYDEATGEQTKGMLWPLLTGERGHYELAKATSMQLNRTKQTLIVSPYLQAMENMATDSLMLPEQVWDAGEKKGKPTGAATPLGWAHGEYIKFLRSIRDAKVFDTIALVRMRAENLAKQEP